MGQNLCTWVRILVISGAVALAGTACSGDGDDGGATEPGNVGQPGDGMVGDGQEPGDGTDPGDGMDPGIVDPGVVDPGVVDLCVSDEDYFLREVWTPIIGKSCFNCHNPLGQANATDMVYQPAGQVGFLENNLSVFREVSEFERDGISVLLLKPTGQVDHGGGRVIREDSPEYAALEAMLERLANPVACPPAPEDETFFTGVEMLTPAQTLRKASLHLAGRLPEDVELEQVEMGGDQALEALLDKMTREEGFYVRMEEVFNDLLLVEKYQGSTRALDLLNRDYYPGARWYDDEEYDRSGLDADFIEAGRRFSNNSVAREPLKLVSHLLRNNRPFTELVTADYMMLNPFSAMVYGVEGVAWDNPLDPDEFRAVQVPTIPHAGALTSPMYLNRFPTTATNRNRHRSWAVYKDFLATDVLKLAERPIDPTSATHNPTMNDPQCSGCHAVIDPLAGAFQNWNTQGSYEPVDSWYENMREPGFGREVIDGGDRLTSLQWLAQRIAEDRRFGHAMAHIVFKGLTGQAPLGLPVATEEDGQGEEAHAFKLAAYETQQRLFDQLAKDFEANNSNLRVIIKGIVRSPWFRASNFDGDQDEARTTQLAALGTGRLLTPEMLNRKLEVMVGYPWRPRVDQSDYLVREDWYQILYGGIDSDDVIERITEPNGIMAAIQQRMANEMSCLFTARDFVLTADQRVLFPHTEMSYVPEDENGFAVPQAVDSIKRNIQYLHWRFLGERLEMDDPEIAHTYQIFYDTWQEGIELRRDDAIGSQLHYSCQARGDYWTGAGYGEVEVRYDPDYTVRSWMAVLTYLMMDYRFLFE